MKRKKTTAAHSKRWLCLAVSAALTAGTFTVPAAVSADDIEADDSSVYGVTAEEENSSENMDELENALFSLVLDVCNGRKTKSEIYGICECSIVRVSKYVKDGVVRKTYF